MGGKNFFVSVTYWPIEKVEWLDNSPPKLDKKIVFLLFFPQILGESKKYYTFLNDILEDSFDSEEQIP
jgi:hypothetical protein